MSGSSLDGLDLAFCNFDLRKGLDQLSWELIAADTLPFSPMWVSRLHHLPEQDALTFAKTHVYFGHYLAQLVQQFLYKHQLQPDFIASHGHTIFHYPQQRLSVQIGDAAAIAALTELPVVADFRTQDVAIDGEGTPLAPIADYYLFKGFDFYLNLGGIANISAIHKDKIIAFDLGPANQVLNSLAQVEGHPYDKDGALARNGKVQNSLLEALNQMPYFDKAYPKSLDNSWIRQNILPLYQQHPSTIQDRLRTAVEQLSQQVVRSIEQIKEKENMDKDGYRLYLTGGGTHNSFLVEHLDRKCKAVGVQLVVPGEKIINFKEAILIALMGLLRMEEIPNCWSSVTGAKRDSVGGSIYFGGTGRNN